MEKIQKIFRYNITKSFFKRNGFQSILYSNEFPLNNKQNIGEKDHKQSTLNAKHILIGAGAGGCLAYYLLKKRRKNLAGKYRRDLPIFSLEEVSSHNTKENRIWMTYKEGVYDITDYIKYHPGGDQILTAAGSSVEPFWMMYAFHENSHVYDILEKYRIGNIKYEEMKQSDPYFAEPKRHAALKPASMKPFNAEVSPELLVESFITPNEFFYIRNHLPVPEVDPNSYELEIEIDGKTETTIFTLDQLKKLPKKTVTVTLMCAGNRRRDMIKIKPIDGLNLGAGSIGTATFTGVALRDVLLLAGFNEDDDKYKHVQFEGLDSDAAGKMYGASISIRKAMEKRGDVLLAYEMNNVPIPRDHGFPVRVIIPGVAGARNVKWLGKIIVSDKESDCHWQQNDYKGFSPSTDWDTVDFTKSPAIQELPVISAICQPIADHSVKVEDGKMTVKGYAWSGNGQKIVRVDVTADGGKTWHVANFDHQDTAASPQHWAWTLWSVKIPVDKKSKSVEIWAKAVDSSYNTQPESFENIWNFRGVLSNAYHRVKVNLKH